MKEDIKRGIAPEHPGIILRELYVEPLGLNNTELAANLDVTRVTINRLLNGKQGITADMAIRLSKAFSTTPQLWLNLQQEFDLWKAKERVTAIIKPIYHDKINPTQRAKRALG